MELDFLRESHAGSKGCTAGVDLLLGEANSRSLHFAPPDFLWRLVASMNFMRLSLRKAAYVALSSAA